MTFKDIFKSNFLESVTQISVVDILIGMVIALLLGLFIFIVYKKTYTGVMYSTGFALALIGLSLVTTLVIMAVTSNVVLSLGMVGALSIVRFRTAIKDPIEIVFLFWSIAVGIVVGAGLISLAIIGSVIIGIILILFANKKIYESPYIIIAKVENEQAEDDVLKIIEESTERYVVKTKTVTKQGIELTMEIRLKDKTTSFVNRITEISGVNNATLVSYNGEYMA